MTHFAADIEDYTALLNNLYAYKEGWMSFKEMVDILCLLIKKDRYHFIHELDGAISE